METSHFSILHGSILAPAEPWKSHGKWEPPNLSHSQPKLSKAQRKKRAGARLRINTSRDGDGAITAEAGILEGMPTTTSFCSGLYDASGAAIRTADDTGSSTGTSVDTAFAGGR